MKKIYILLALFFASYLFNGIKAQSFCYTEPISDNMKFNIDLGSKNNIEDEYHLRIYVHVIRHTDGTGGQTVGDVNDALSFLNSDFNIHGIFFEWDCEIDYIDNDYTFANPNSSIFSVNNHYDGIDIYMFDDNAPGFGLANGVGSYSEFLVSGSYWNPPYGSLVKSHVISHEMGHVLFLWHTHHQFESGGCEEFVDGSNCSVCGDYVCDTPSDPYLGFNVDPITCDWLGSGVDSHGDPYDPDEHIIMSYTSPDCMEYFTNGEGKRMRGAIATLEYLQATITNEIFESCCVLDKLGILPSQTGTADICDGGVLCIYDVSTSPPVLLSNTGYNVKVEWSTGDFGQCVWWSGGSGVIYAKLTQYYGGWTPENVVCEKKIKYEINCDTTCELKLKTKISECFDNGTEYYISDDYYNVIFSVAGTGGAAWTAYQVTPGSSIETFLFSGIGDQVVTLPQNFLIQNGSWVLIIRLNQDPDCAVKVEINPPEYCSGCHHDIKIFNKKCYKSGWSFDIIVNNPVSPGPVVLGWFTSNPPGVSGTYGVVQNIYVAGFDCIDFAIYDDKDKECVTKLTVCPPSPCDYDCAPKFDYSVSSCIFAGFDENQNPIYVYYVKVSVQTLNNDCWEAFRIKDGIQISLGTYYGSQTVVFGPFPANEGTWTLVIKYCDNDCKSEVEIKSPFCKKDGGGKGIKLGLDENGVESESTKITVYPNPLLDNRLTISVNDKIVSYKVVGIDRRVYIENTPISGTQNIKFDYPAGVYFIMFQTIDNKLKVLKFIKM